MQFVYQPEGVEKADAQRWDFEPGKLMSPEAEVIERKTGFTYAEWTQKVTSGSMLALHGLLYVMLKRDQPTLKWEQVQFNLDELDFELSDEETAQTIAGLEERARSDDLDAQGQALLETLRADAPAVVDDDEDAAPKG